MALRTPNPLPAKTERGDVVAIMVTNCGWINRIDRSDRQDTRTWCGRKCPAALTRQWVLRNVENHFCENSRCEQRKDTATDLLRPTCRRPSKSRPERRADRSATSSKSAASGAFAQLQRINVFCGLIGSLARFGHSPSAIIVLMPFISGSLSSASITLLKTFKILDAWARKAAVP